MTCGRNACAVFTTYEPAGYDLPAAWNAWLARCTTTPDLSKALTKRVAVGKSGWSDGRMNPRGIAPVLRVEHVVELRPGSRLPPRPPPPAKSPPWALARGRRAHLLGDGRLDRRDLLRRQCPGIGAAARDGVAAHHVAAIQEALAVLRREVEDCAVGGQQVLDRLPLVPHLLRLDRERLVAVGQEPLRQERDADRRRVADDLAQQTDLVVEPGRRPHAAVEPGGVRRGAAHDRPGLPSVMNRWWIAAPTSSMPCGTSGS